MAQSDYVIGANPSGLAMRTEINTIFDSILTNNSGSTAPTVTSAFMMWVDTSNATYYYLKMRNHDNTAWVTLFIYTVSTKVITPFIINSPITNSLTKVNADGSISSTSITEADYVVHSISSLEWVNARSITDANSIQDSNNFWLNGIFSFSNASNTPTSYGSLIQTSRGGGEVSQLAFSIISTQIWYRYRLSGTWSAWVEK